MIGILFDIQIFNSRLNSFIEIQSKISGVLSFSYVRWAWMIRIGFLVASCSKQKEELEKKQRP